MHKVKFNTRTLDKATGAIYEPSNEFVEVSEAFALRIKELQKDVRHANSFEFQVAKEFEDKPIKRKK